MKLNSTESLKGEYVFYKNGVEVYRSKNIITTKGKDSVIAYLSKQSYEYATKITLGVGTGTPAVTDEFMGFEIFPVPVQFKTIDATQTPTQIVFRATLPAVFKGVITEAGLASIGGVLLGGISDINDNNDLIAVFDDTYEAWSTPANVVFVSNDLEGTPLLRIGDSGLQITASGGTITSTYDNISSYVGSYTAGDKMKVAFNVASSVPTSVSIKFANDSSNYYTATIPAANMALGYNVKTIDFSSMTVTGAPLIQNTTSISVSVASSSSSVVTMDGIRFDEYSDLDKATLVSRSLLATPLVVEGGYPFDIEYRLGFNL
jgi:hypothetical protein